MATEATTFGDLLRRYRGAAGLTQEELAERAGISVRGLSDLERGVNRAPYRDTLERLIAALSLAAGDAAALREAGSRRRGPAPEVARPAPLLPVPPTPLLGREREEAAIVHLLTTGSARLVTLTGPGGVGKTRLALQVAGTIAVDHRPDRQRTRGNQSANGPVDDADGVTFVPLAAVREPALVPSTIARHLGVREEGRRSGREVLIDYLADRTVLLVLDNFEHLIEAAPIIAELLAASPGLRILATSRRPLRLRSEQMLEIGPLVVPPAGDAVDEDAIAHYPSIALFVQRARAVRPDFTLTPRTVSAVAAIVRKLDGLPLAIELAAARIKVLSPPELLAWMDQPLEILSRGSVDMPSRHQTIKQTIGWSYDLLASEEQRLWRRLGVFVGGWSHEAARAVAGNEQSPIAVLDALSSLAEASLVTAERRDDLAETRFTMLETIREYALDRLDSMGEAEEARDRHAAYFLGLAEEARPELRGYRQAQWMERLETDHDNLRAALRRLLARAPAEEAVRLAGALWPFWESHGHVTEGRRWLEQALAASDSVSPRARANALLGAGLLALAQAEYAAATARVEESLALFRELGDTPAVAHALNSLGSIALDAADYDRAARYCEESLALRREMGDRLGVASSLGDLGLIAWGRGDLTRARQIMTEGLEMFRELGDTGRVTISLANLGLVAYDEGDYEAAAALHRESLALAQALGDGWSMVNAIEGLAEVAKALQAPERAAHLWGVAQTWREANGIPLKRDEEERHERAVAEARQLLDEATWTAAWQEGQAMPLDQAVAYALQS